MKSAFGICSVENLVRYQNTSNTTDMYAPSPALRKHRVNSEVEALPPYSEEGFCPDEGDRLKVKGKWEEC